MILVFYYYYSFISDTKIVIKHLFSKFYRCFFTFLSLYFVFYHLFGIFAVEREESMQLRIKEILKERGMKMTELAAKVGIDQSNLTKSLDGNPTLSRLEEIAKALGLPVRELLPDAPPVSPAGVLDIGGRRFALVPMPEMAETKADTLPDAPEMTPEALKKEICNLVQQGSSSNNQQAFCGSLLGHRIVVLYDEACKVYMWLLWHNDGKVSCHGYTRYFDIDEGDVRRTMEWDGDTLADIMVEDIQNLKAL